MAKQVVTGALLNCSFGAAPSIFNATVRPVTSSYMTCGTIMDNIPMTNIMPFGLCTAPTNPAVQAAGGAPVPCIPVTVAPWVPGSPTHMIHGTPALNDMCKLMCMWAGVITVMQPGQFQEDIP